MIKVRPHALHRIMGEPRSIDPRLITDGVAAILRRTKRTDEEKALIQSLKNRTLSEGAKTAVEEWVVERAYGFKDFAGNKYTEKGLTLEDHAIKTVQMNSLFTMGQYVHMNKNEQTFENSGFVAHPTSLIQPMAVTLSVHGLGFSIHGVIASPTRRSKMLVMTFSAKPTWT